MRPLQTNPGKGGGNEMVRINLLPEQDPKNLILLEKIIWVVGFALPFAIILWARLAVNSK